MMQLMLTKHYNYILVEILSLMSYPIIYTLALKIDKKYIYKTSIHMLLLNLVLVTADAVYRFINSKVSSEVMANLERHDSVFYIFKLNSMMFHDSNGVGNLLVPLYFFTLYLESKFDENLFVIKLLLFVLCISTFSRAAILAIVVFQVLYSLKKKMRKLKTLILLLIPIIAGIAGILSLKFYDFYQNDLSFQSKLEIIFDTIEVVNKSSFLENTIGIGLENSPNVIGRSAHNILVTYLLETGLVGLFLLINLWVIIYFKSKGKLFYIMFAYLLCGMSFAGIAKTFLYAIFAVVNALESKRVEN